MNTIKIILASLVTIVLLSTSAFADGLIIIRDPAPPLSPFPLEVIYHRVDVKIN